MFTWICPQCGREVPPSSAECPNCAERRQQASQPAPPQAPGAPAYPPPNYPPQGYAQQPYPPQGYPPPPAPAPAVPPQPPQFAPPQPPQFAPPLAQSQYAPPQPYQPQQGYYPPQGQPPQQPVYTIGNEKKSVPTWLVALITLAVIGGGLFGLYKFVSARNGTGTASSTASPAEQQAPGAKAHPYARYLEVAGVRLMESADKKPVVRFGVVNHSPTELSGLELRITFRSNTGKEDSEPFAVVDAKVGSVPAHGFRDMESPLATSLRIYELPDWQFVKASFEITAPK